MEKLQETLKRYNGRDVIISISHQLYGNQKIKTKLNYIFDSALVGFRVQKQLIGIKREEIIRVNFQDGITFASNIMKINIRLQVQ